MFQDGEQPQDPTQQDLGWSERRDPGLQFRYGSLFTLDSAAWEFGFIGLKISIGIILKSIILKITLDGIEGLGAWHKFIVEQIN